jgi:hypothetical protein
MNLSTPALAGARWRSLRRRVQLEDLFALGFVSAFISLSLALRRPFQMPWLLEPVIPGGVLLLAYGVGARRYFEVRREGGSLGTGLRASLVLAGWTLRRVGPFLIGILFFEGLRGLTAFASLSVRDAAMVAGDRALLGQDVGVLMERLGRPALTSVMIVVYALHFLTLPLVAFLFHARRQDQAAHHVMVALLILGVLGLAGYFAVPVVGPYVYQAELFPARYPGGGTVAAGVALATIDRIRGVATDCFPSLHTGHVLVIAACLHRYARRIFWGYLPFGAAVVFSTLYLRMHYLMDLLAAVPAAFIAVAAAIRLHDRWTRAGQPGAHRVPPSLTL